MPDILLLSLDTVRADAIGRSPTVTPHLDRLMAESIVFERAVSEMPFTLAAHMTLLTGTAPDVHQVTREGHRLADGVPALAELLRGAGYRTVAVVSSSWIGPDFGFSRGFDTFHEVPHGLATGERVLELADREIAASAGPLFLFVHDYDAHSDFERNGNLWPYFASDAGLDRLPDECVEHRCSPEAKCATGYLGWANRNPDQVSAAAVACLHGAYLEGVRDLDRRLGGWLDGLRGNGWYDDAAILLTSDHGEEFAEHGLFLHSRVHHETTAIPLALKPPGAAGVGRRDRRLAQLADVAPTLLGLVGVEVPAQMTGYDLLGDEVRPEAVSQNKHRPVRYAVVSGRWKLIHDDTTGRALLYDLSTDPGELTDVARQHPAEVARLRLRLEDLRRAWSEGAPDGAARGNELDPERRKTLEALGYLN